MSLAIVSNKPAPGPVTISLTLEAVKQIRATMKAERFMGGLRVEVVGGGCSGFNYVLNFEDEIVKGDTILEIHGLTVYIDSMSAPYIKGIEIDYNNKGLQSGFTFTNPNAKKTCGCGTSFST